MAVREPREGDPVTIRGDERRDVWIVKARSVSLGAHEMIALLTVPPGDEKWNRPDRIVPLSECEPVPVDLEDFPCSPV